jgi:hypothetical protein
VIKTQLYLKVEMEHEETRDGQKLTLEIAKAIKRIYGVRSVEVSNSMSEEIPGFED